ncbi:hypothetical protein BDB01DRAFT_771326 [Pilobolus umbonatus]|nr:hypothetical protein BDB01DRAFT_771326 [Pilobolus umbonatus]
MTPIWSKRSTAPCTIFATTSLSPRQIANKAYTLGNKKLDRDDRSSKQKYHMRERLLLYVTIAKAEEVLNSRTRRTNRRVMSAEEEEEGYIDQFIQKQQTHTNEHHSPLRSSASESDMSTTETIPSSALLPRDCRIAITHDSRVITSPITASI